MPRTKESKTTILEKLIEDVETLYLELMELRHKSNELDDEEARSRYLTYQKNYYHEWIKTNQRRMQLRKQTSKQFREQHKPEKKKKPQPNLSFTVSF